MDAMTHEEYEAFKNVVQAFNDCLLIECKKRCPDNEGYEQKCDGCEVQHLSHVINVAKLGADRSGMLFALRWLIEAGHSPFEALRAP